MIKLLVLDEITDSQWNKLYRSASHATFFQSKACVDFYSKLNFLKPFVLGVEEDNALVGLACGYLIADGGVVKRFFSRRAIFPGGLMLDEKISDAALTALLNGIKVKLKHQAIYIEIRNYVDYAAFKNYFSFSGFTYQPYVNFHVSTPDREWAYNQLSASKKRQIRQSEKAGMICNISENTNDMVAFYDILKELYQKKVRKPLFPIAFFLLLMKQPFARFFVVKKENKVCGGICCVQSDKVVYEWFIAGEFESDNRCYPSVLATWKAIEYAALNGFTYFDFMGAGKRDEPYGVREFKSKFGGKLVEHGRFLYLTKPVLYRFGKTMLHLYNKMR